MLLFQTYNRLSFQGSNDTISARWAFVDLESGIVDYQWAIGTAPNETDIQPFISVGRELTGINSDLGDVLMDNTTYYVTVIATNGAGLTRTETSNGVTFSSSILNLTALEEVVEIEFVRSLVVVNDDYVGETEEFVLLVIEQEDRAAITWEGVSNDVEDICMLPQVYTSM